ncbi:MAG: TolC family protein, partial [Paracoccus hibiscisoli]|uniref:TolC family protein n=1 Tax=Paracoccus hibiscisoli TaxID=2023261 RepID=UPI003918FD87
MDVVAEYEEAAQDASKSMQRRQSLARMSRKALDEQSEQRVRLLMAAVAAARADAEEARDEAAEQAAAAAAAREAEAQACSRAEAAEARVADAQVSLAAEVAQAYIDLRDQQQRLILAVEATRTDEQSLSLTRQLYERGAASLEEVARLRTQLA